MRLCFSILICAAAYSTYGIVMCEVAVPSGSMGKDISASVILPDSYFRSYFDTGVGRLACERPSVTRGETK